MDYSNDPTDIPFEWWSGPDGVNPTTSISNNFITTVPILNNIGDPYSTYHPESAWSVPIVPQGTEASTVGPTTTRSTSRNRQPRQHRHTDEEWERYEQKIKRLYIDEGKALREVKKIMAREHDFNPSNRQYKDKLAEWRYHKKLPTSIALWMQYKAKERKTKEGKETEFHYGGKIWKPLRIQQTINRAVTHHDENYPRDIHTPPGITCTTPTEPNAPTLGMDQSLESLPSEGFPRPLVTRQPGLNTGFPSFTWNGHNLADFEKIVSEARELNENGNLVEAERNFRDALAGYEQILSPTHEKTTAVAYQLASVCAKSQRMTDAHEVLDQVSRNYAERWSEYSLEMARHYLQVVDLFDSWGRRDDAVVLVHRILDIYENGDLTQNPRYDSGATATYTALPYMPRTGVNLFPGSVDDLNPSDIDQKLQFVEEHMNDTQQVELSLDRLIEKCEENPDRFMNQAIQVKCALVKLYHRSNNIEKLTNALNNLRETVLSAKWTILRDRSFARTMKEVGALYNLLGYDDEGRELFSMLEDMAEDDSRMDKKQVMTWLIHALKHDLSLQGL